MMPGYFPGPILSSSSQAPDRSTSSGRNRDTSRIEVYKGVIIRQSGKCQLGFVQLVPVSRQLSCCPKEDVAFGEVGTVILRPKCKSRPDDRRTDSGLDALNSIFPVV